MIFLIAHKVRGEPAFDVAELLSIGPEEAWIIPTSGHRAYPLAYWAIEDLADLSDYPHPTPWTIIDKLDGEITFSTETGKGTTFRVALPL